MKFLQVEMKSNLDHWQEEQSKQLLVFILVMMGIMLASIIAVQVATGQITLE